MLKFLSLIGLSMGIIVVAGCGKKQPAADDARYVKVFTVGESVNSSKSTFHGVVHAEYEPSLSFRVAGKITERKVDIGQSVKKGQILASLDPSDYRLSADSAIAQTAASKSNYVTQRANLERYKQLLQQNFVSQAQYDSQKAQFDSAKAQYEQSQNQLANSQNQVRYTTLLAPADGIISSITMDAGQVVTSGQTVATMAVSGNKEVEVELPEAQINNYILGMPVQLKIWATDKCYAGKIRSINQASDQQTRTFTARIVIINPDTSIKYGMSADAKVQPLNDKDGTMLPLSSLYAKDGKTFVWSMGADSQAVLVAVSVISTDGNSMKIQPGVLHDNQKIVAAGTNFVYAGQKLKVYTD